MRTDELYKFSDGTLNDVRTALHDIAVRIRMDYLPMRKLKRFNTLAGNPVKEILLKLNLPDHRILKDGGEVEFCIDLIPRAMPVAKSLIVWHLQKCKNSPTNLRSSKEKVSYDLVLHYGERREPRFWLRFDAEEQDLFSDFDCEIRYHPCKANIVADALSRKEWMKPRRDRAMSMKIHSSIKAEILEAQIETSKNVNTSAKIGLEK
nr:reverse transcriptase domain-containing protein [Tanacetum cinerariifolium]